MDADRVLLGNLLLSRGQVERAAHLRADEQWQRAARIAPTSTVIAVADGHVLMDGAQLARRSAAELTEVDLTQVAFLGVEADTAYFVHLLPPSDSDGQEDRARETLAAGWKLGTWVPLRQSGEQLDDRDAGLAVTAVALDHWQRSHRHCPRCGARTTMSSSGWSMVCPVDGSEHFPRTDPAVICLVRDRDDRALLARQGAWSSGWFSTLAGFVEAGESAEAALRREVREESGIVVGDGPHDIAYLGSQPWPFPRSLMLGYHAWTDYPAIAVDGKEIHEARWFTREELARACASGEVRLPPSISIARRLVERWYGSELPGDWSRPLGEARR